MPNVRARLAAAQGVDEERIALTSFAHRDVIQDRTLAQPAQGPVHQGIEEALHANAIDLACIPQVHATVLPDG